LQWSAANERPATAARTGGSVEAATAENDEDGLVVGSKPFYPEVTVSHVETPSKFYVLELCRKESLSA